MTQLGGEVSGLPVFHWLRKRSGNRNVSNAEPHSSRIGHDLAAETQHLPERIREAYNSYMSLLCIPLIRPVHVPQDAKQNLIESNIIRKITP